MGSEQPKIEKAIKTPEIIQTPAPVELENFIPPQYAGLPSEVAEEIWTEPVYVDEEQNRAVQGRREAGLAQIRERENTREATKDKLATEQYAQLSEDRKKEFPSLQQKSAEGIAQHIKGTKKIKNLSSEEIFILSKAEDVWKESQKEKPGAPLTMTFDREIDKKIYANLLNKLAFDQVKVKKAEAEQQKLNKVREDLGLPPEIKPATELQHEKKLETKVESKETPDLVELKRVFDRMIGRANRPSLKKAQEDLYNNLKNEGNKTKIAEVILEGLRQEKRTADYPANPEYEKAWEDARRKTEGIGSKVENDWNYRGEFASKESGTKTETRGSLNIDVTPDVVRELDDLIKRGVFKGNYKFGDPNTGASALARHDAVTLYFLENPSEEAKVALSDIAKRNLRGENLLGKKISEGFYMSEVGSVSGTHAKGLIEKLNTVDDKLGKAVGNFLTDRTGRIAMSEAQYYATKETLNLYGYDISYDKEKGMQLGKFEQSEKGDKEKKWEERRKEIEQITDATGRGIDEGIKETVTAFNVNEISTSQSCEGHDEVEGGHRPWPWVEVAAPDEPEERFIGEAEAFVKAAQENNIPLEELKKGSPEEVYWKLRRETSQSPVTPEYQAWEEKNKRLRTKVIELLGEFYNNREAKTDVRLQAEESEGNSFEISSEREALNRFLNNELNDEEKKNLLDKLPKRQKEMRDFTEFLKKRYLES